MNASVALDGLRRRRAEWGPWLAVVAEVVRETDAAEWDSAVPAAADGRDTIVPRLANTTVAVPVNPLRRFLERLIRTASQDARPRMASVRRALSGDLDVLSLFAASVCQSTAPISKAAASSGVDPEALQAVVALLAVPFLHACARRLAPSVAPAWVQGYCPICGAWPSFAEIRGIERSRAFRCGRCGAGWHARALCCPYCQTIDHDELVALMPDNASSELNATIDACNRCRGYVKTFTRLQGCPAADVMLEDLGSVELDVAAIGEGYMRSAGAGYDLTMNVIEQPRRLFRWKQ